jgi:hypothetical protein
MRKSKLLIGILAASLALSPAFVSAGLLASPPPGKTFGNGATGWVWGVFGCSGGIIFTALVANWTQNRQLTWNEAATCGLLFWLAGPQPRRR